MSCKLSRHVRTWLVKGLDVLYHDFSIYWAKIKVGASFIQVFL